MGRIIAAFLLIALLILNASAGKLYQLTIVKEIKAEKPKKNIIYYRVKPGEHLLGIMRRFKIPPKKLSYVVRINRLKNPNKIYPGQVLKLPSGRTVKRAFRVEEREDVSPVIRSLGGEVENSGYILLNSGTVNLSQTPKMKVGDSPFILDLNGSIGEDEEEELKRLGIGVLKGIAGFRETVENLLINNFGSFDSNGTLEFGNRCRLVYRYDYAVFDESTGDLKVFNLKSDTPESLKELLSLYGVSVYQPESLKEKGVWGEIKLLPSGEVERMAALLKVVTGSDCVYDSGILCRDYDLFISPESADVERRSFYAMKGFSIVQMTGSFLQDVRSVLRSIGIPSEKVKLLIVEPPGSSGERSKFTVKGMLIHAKDRDWLLLDDVDNPQEVKYMRSRGVNLIFY